jgi:hypothetical protein
VKLLSKQACGRVLLLDLSQETRGGTSSGSSYLFAAAAEANAQHLSGAAPQRAAHSIGRNSTSSHTRLSFFFLATPARGGLTAP